MNDFDDPIKPFAPDNIDRKNTSWQYVIYIVYLTLLIILAILQIKQKDNNIVIGTDIGLYNALKRPLEGTWAYNVKWTMFHGETTHVFNSHGEAYFLWDNDNNRNFWYEIYIGYNISKIHEKPSVVAYIEGTWKTDENGQPIDRENFRLEYAGRMGNEQFKTASTNVLDFQNVKFEYQNNNVYKITAEHNFKDPMGITTSVGEISFQKK